MVRDNSLKLVPVGDGKHSVKVYRGGKLIGSVDNKSSTYYGFCDAGASGKHYSRHFKRLGLELNEVSFLRLYDVVDIHLGVRDKVGCNTYSTTLDELIGNGGVYPLSTDSLYLLMDTCKWVCGDGTVVSKAVVKAEGGV